MQNANRHYLRPVIGCADIVACRKVPIEDIIVYLKENYR